MTRIATTTAAVLLCLGLPLPAALASAGGIEGMGGLAPPAAPTISSAKCGTDEGYGCFRTYRVQPGGAVAISGTGLAEGAQVVFRGGEGAADDRSAPASFKSPGELVAQVPDGAASGPVVVVNPDTQESNPSHVIAIAELPRRAGGPGPIVQAVTVSPRQYFYRAERQAALTLQIQRDGPDVASASVELVQVETGTTVRNWSLGRIASGVPVNVKWDGTDGVGAVLPEGRYAFKFSLTDGQGRQTAKATVRLAAKRTRSRRPAAKLKTAPGTVLFLKNAFPIQGKYNLTGFGAGGRFGAGRGGRSHQGQDVPAACGTPLVAVESGLITWKDTHPLAGNYIVLSGASKNDYAYMHLRDPALIAKGQQVATGQLLGYVGQTGDASACHLHFELWPGGHWQQGGRPVDPLPFLRRMQTAG